jgi:hypothetical protein
LKTSYLHEASDGEILKKSKINTNQGVVIGGTGNLLIKIQNANLTRDANNVQKMSPFCMFDLLGLPSQ